MDLCRPDYAGGGIVNLMQSIASACGAAEYPYPPCALLGAEELAATRQIVLIVIDGLGADLLPGLPATSLLRQQQRGTLTSVFPSTTASAIGTFMSGLAPAQHGLTGWHVYLRELARTVAVLPLTPRGGEALATEGLPPRLFGYPSLFQRVGRACTVVSPAKIATTPFNAWHARGAQTVPYEGLLAFFSALGEAMQAPQTQYLYGYFADLDSVSHRFGKHSPAAQRLLAQIDAAFAKFVAAQRGRDAWILLTADHGFIDAPAERVICLDDHPAFAGLLQHPLSGERRAAYCYVGPENHAAFQRYVAEHFADAMDCVPSRQLIDEGWFGPPPYHAELESRVGDFTLLMKEDWTIKDWLPDERRYSMLGVHGGTSPAEMQVPLIAVRV